MPRLVDLLRAATRRQAREHHRLALIIAYAVNDPKHLDKVAPAPGAAQRDVSAENGSSTLGKGPFEQEQWW